ncbi:CoA transferase [Pollutimonas nitritireducens]|uniref:CoA transferase n=1 Tax=Pollutimonas nitritireducens TaxID=2045209 RepID=A0A2N4UG40_9BURK|nr:CoA transferase [Pollutimonas nitritireducens]PLC53970.1 CoA transferase [Pollutimonas nitritireducens]
MSGSLSGIKVVDLTSVVMGPYATQIFGDMGAEVIKVESPYGDIMRHMGATEHPLMGPIHVTLNRNKRSVMLDLQQPAAREALLRIVRSADVFVHSMRADAINRLGLGYEAISEVRPDIVYCNAYGYGKAGPYSNEPAYDDMIQGMSGLAALNTELAGEPRYTPTIIGDKVSGLTIAYAVMGALVHRARTGEGQELEVPMFESLVSFIMVEHLWQRTYDPEHGSLGYPRVLTQLRKPHRTTDGYICLLPYTDRNWVDFFELAGRPELATDPRYTTATARSVNFDSLYKDLGGLIAGHSTEWWLDQCRPLSIPVARVNSLEDLLDDPHLNEVGMFFKAEHPHLGVITQVKPPVNFGRTPSEVRRPAPRLGEHSRDVLVEAGLSQEEVNGLVNSGATV